MKFRLAIWILVVVALVSTVSAAPASTRPMGKQTSHVALAQTPPMGWNSWNKFACNVNEQLIRETADAMVTNGMKDAGYQYVNIDDCWQVDRAADGSIVVDSHFPSGIKALADYVHGKGLKLGIYTDAGHYTCQKRPGSYDHEKQDIDTYAAWGVDYVKIDWCYAEGLDPEVQYVKFRDAIAAASHPIVFSLCNWGVKAPWRWGAKTGNSWRTTGDISDNWDSMSSIGFSQDGLERFSKPGHWNDPDMLEVGNGGMKKDEYRTHMALWAILAAPLLAGNDLRSMNAETHDMLTNREVIAVNQDKLGKQGRRVWHEGPLEIWARPLADGSHAVALFNRGSGSIRMTLPFGVIGVTGTAALRDLWEHKDLMPISKSYSADVPEHGVVLLKVSEAKVKKSVTP